MMTRRLDAPTYERIAERLSQLDRAMEAGTTNSRLVAWWSGPHPQVFKHEAVTSLRAVSSSADDQLTKSVLSQRAAFWLGQLPELYVKPGESAAILAGVVASACVGDQTAERCYSVYTAALAASDLSPTHDHSGALALLPSLQALTPDERAAVAPRVHAQLFVDTDRPRDCTLSSRLAKALYAALRAPQPDTSTRLASALRVRTDGTEAIDEPAIRAVVRLLPRLPRECVVTVDALQSFISGVAERAWTPIEVCLLGRHAERFVATADARSTTIPGIAHELACLVSIANAQPEATRALAKRLDGG